jgi:release factor glutamine methyltransferase
MKYLGEVLQLAAKYLEKASVSHPRRVAEELLAFVLKEKRLALYMQFDRPLVETELQSYRDLLKKAATGEPVDYILEEVEFYHCRFRVSPAVLIPRQETEILLDKACEELVSAKGQEPLVVWDVCCGSGCLGIALKKKCPQFEVSLSDLSSAALDVAKHNALLNEAEVSFFEGDLLHPFAGKRADVILCNPPYISEAEYAVLDRSVKQFEPKMALTAGNGGLECYERLADELPRYLNACGRVFLEIGSTQGEDVKKIFNSSFWKVKRLEKDWAGHDRFFFLEAE